MQVFLKYSMKMEFFSKIDSIFVFLVTIYTSPLEIRHFCTHHRLHEAIRGKRGALHTYICSGIACISKIQYEDALFQ